MLSQNPGLLDAAANRLFITGMHESATLSYISDMATAMTTTKRTETMAHIGDGPAMELIRDGEKYVFTPMSNATISATMQKYGAGIAVTQEDWDDDQLGGYNERFMEMGDESVLLPNALLMAALIDGDLATSLSYDGVSFFNTAHPIRGQQTATQSNVYTGSGTTTAAVITDLNGVIGRFGGFRRENGRAANPSIRRITICAPWALREPIVTALEAMEVASSSNVTLKGISWTVIFDVDLDDDDVNDYYVINASARLRGLVYIEREAARLIPENQNSGPAFDSDVRRWKSKLRAAIMYGRWMSTIKVTNV